MKAVVTFCAAALVMVSSAQAAIVSGNPSADAGWSLTGNSLSKGVYVTGNANYGFDAYSAGFTVQSGSNLEISDGALSWLAGDTVLGVGGRFQSITAAQAGWTSMSGSAVNSLLPTVSPYQGPKLQAKFGTSAATWSASTVAPGSGNGSSGSSAGAGRVQIRTSGYFQTGTPAPGQTEPWTWDGNSGQLLVLDKADHILWRQGSTDVSPDKRVARMVWNWDDTAKRVTSWELLLNVTLLDRLNPSFSGPLPAIGDKAIMTVQLGDSGGYTDALVNVTPEPGTIALLALGGLLVARRRK